MKKLALCAALPIILATAPSVAFSDTSGQANHDPDCHPHEKHHGHHHKHHHKHHHYAAGGTGFDGWYAGVSIGGAMRGGRGHSTATSTITVPATGSTGTVSVDLRHETERNSFLGNLALGFGWNWCDFYAGLEAFVNFADHRGRGPRIAATSTAALAPVGATLSSTATYGLESRLNSVEWGLDLRPGYVYCNDTLFYGRIGFAINRLRVRTSPSVTFVTTGAAAALPAGTGAVATDRHRHRAALRLGLGMERRFFDCWSIRADYVHTYYGRVQASGTFRRAGTTPAGVAFTSVTSGTTNHKLYGNAVTVGLFYYW